MKMTVSEWLGRATNKLSRHKIQTARLDALVLLEDALAVDRSKLLAEPDIEIAADKLEVLTNLLNRRAAHEPLAYIRGKTEFYGREFVVTPAVLEPRPESEMLIDMLKELVQTAENLPSTASRTPRKGPRLRIADVGAGSGALGITAQLELPTSSVDLLEIDPDAIEVAKTNVDLFTLNISVIESDLLAQSMQDYHILVCNLPYVPDDLPINQAASFEPSLAIYAGFDGLYQYRRLFSQAGKLAFRPLYILSEAFPPQHEQLQAEAAKEGYDLIKATDFIQIFSLAE